MFIFIVGYQKKLSPFQLDDRELVDYEVFDILVNNFKLDGSLWNMDDETAVKCSLYIDLLARHVDYRFVGIQYLWQTMHARTYWN